MNRNYICPILFALAAFCIAAAAQGPGADSAGGSNTTVRGCLTQSRGNYLVVEDKTGLVYTLKGVGTKLNGQVGHEVEVTGRLLPGTVKTGVRPSKEGSNPSDTVHGIDGVPLEIKDVHADVKTLSQHCKAADAA
jgi:hypothetical protein